MIPKVIPSNILLSMAEGKSNLKNYDNSGEATAGIIDDFSQRNGKKPSVIAFGECHSISPEISKNTAEYFAENIIPQLAKKGYKDLVLECFPISGNTDKDLWFYNTLQSEIGRLDIDKDRNFVKDITEDKYPLLRISLGATANPQGFLEIVLSAKKNGINIHGGGLQFTQALEIIKFPQKYSAIKQIEMINTNSYEAIETLLRRGKCVATYNGALHNNTKGENSELFFGDDFIKKYGAESYLEVDLIVPEVLIKQEEHNQLSAYLAFVPSKGVNRYTESGNKEVIIFKDNPADIKKRESECKEIKQMKIDARKKIRDNIGKLKKLYEMPVIWERFRIYDKNGIEGLSADEIVNMNDHDAGGLFCYAVEDGKISFNDALDILLKLPVNKMAKTLRNMSSIISGIENMYFNEVVKRDLDKAVEIVINIEEEENDIGFWGFSAYRLMSELPKDLWDKIIGNVKAKDSKYAEAIEHQKEIFENCR